MLHSSFTDQKKRQLFLGAYYNQQEVFDQRIAKGIEENRKGNCRLRITDQNGTPLKNRPVKIVQKTHDFKYGANIFMLDEFEKDADNKEYRRFFKEYFNLATIPFYWSTLEPTEGKPRYLAHSPKVYRRPAPDLCLDYCQENGIDAKLHCLVYEHFVPEWLKTLPKEQVKEKYEERFQQISQRYSGKLYEFEVTNELLNYWSDSPISLDKDLLEWAFCLARKYFPKETLVINEGNQLPDFPKKQYRHPYYLMLENAFLKGLPIDKIGVQHHQFTGADISTDEDYDRSIEKYASICDPSLHFQGLDILGEFGLPMEITEVTISTLGETEADEELQADLLKLWYSIWFSHPGVNTVVYWNTVDGYTHISGNWNENHCRGGLFHHDLTPKKSALVLKELFSKIWHTDLELTTDEDGWIDFRGFYGNYLLEAENTQFHFGLHKHENNTFEWSLHSL